MTNYIPITDRTEDFAMRIIKACTWLNNQGQVARTISNQLLRSGTSIGANVAGSRSAQSNRDFLNKMEIARQSCKRNPILVKAFNQIRISRA